MIMKNFKGGGYTNLIQTWGVRQERGVKEITKNHRNMVGQVRPGKTTQRNGFLRSGDYITLQGGGQVIISLCKVSHGTVYSDTGTNDGKMEVTSEVVPSGRVGASEVGLSWWGCLNQ